MIPFHAKIQGSKDIKNYTQHLVDNAGGAVLSWLIEGARKVIAVNTRLPDRSVSLMQLALIGKAMTGLETSSMNVVRGIKAIRKSPVTSTTDTESIAVKTENTQEVHLIFIPHLNRQDINVRG